MSSKREILINHYERWQERYSAQYPDKVLYFYFGEEDTIQLGIYANMKELKKIHGRVSEDGLVV